MGSRDGLYKLGTDVKEFHEFYSSTSDHLSLSTIEGFAQPGPHAVHTVKKHKQQLHQAAAADVYMDVTATEIELVSTKGRGSAILE